MSFKTKILLLTGVLVAQRNNRTANRLFSALMEARPASSPPDETESQTARYERSGLWSDQLRRPWIQPSISDRSIRVE